MKLSALNVECQDKKYHAHELSWKRYGVKLKRAFNMLEAIEMLENENFIIIVINSDSISKYLKQIQVIRGITSTPIHAYTSFYSAKNHANAIKYGADFFTSWDENADDFIDMSLAFINKYNVFNNRSKAPLTYLSHKKLAICPRYRMTVLDGMQIRLNKIEFDLLLYLISNKGFVLTYEQIFRHVWGEEYIDNLNSVLWNQMSHLRSKISPKKSSTQFIENVILNPK